MSTQWRDLLHEVPRDGFLPDVIWTDAPGRSYVPVSRTRDPDRWSALADGDVPVVTQVDDGQTTDAGVFPSSSISQPSVVATMLDALDVRPGHRVLEIGTGTGWNAALLDRRAGPDGSVVSVEIDEALADAARSALAAVESRATVVVGNGESGYALGAPWDRLISTAAARHIPRAWLDQTADGGVVVTPWGTDYCQTLARLTKRGDTASGTVTPGVAFMRLRSQRRLTANPDGVPLDISRADRSHAPVSGMDIYRMITAAEAAFTIGLHVPNCRLLWDEDARGEGCHTVELHDAAGGSWSVIEADVPADRTTVYQHGPRRLWDEVLTSYRWWERTGQPRPDRYGITLTPTGEHVWLDDVTNPVATR